MDPVIIGLMGGLLAGTVGVLTVMVRTGRLTVVLRTRDQTPITMPMLAVRKPRTASPVRRRSISSRAKKERSTATVVRTKRKARNKTHDTPAALGQVPDIASEAKVSFDTCPSCGLQAPGSLLTEHFLGSPSHRNGLPKIVEVDPVEVEAAAEAQEEDSRQSVRNLLQMLIPPRAFGRRHAHRSVSPISAIIENRGPSPGRTHGP
jgi:hypothetical protein